MSRDEGTGRRPGRLSVVQRDIVSHRCKMIDADWRVYCDRCYKTLLLFEETTEYNALAKTSAQTRQFASDFRYYVPVYVVRPYKDVDGWKWDVMDARTDALQTLTEDEFADFIMQHRDQHTHECRLADCDVRPRHGKNWAPTSTWGEEVKANGGSRWR